MKRKDLQKKVPDSPGVYFFIGARGKILYIGKAGSLRDRVRSYFTKDILQSRSPAIVQMIEEARDIRFEKTDSVLEALILEARLIKKHQPKYNVRERDDKSFNYVAITDEDFPAIFTIRERELHKRASSNLKSEILNLKSVYGPFPHGGQLREALRIIRKIFSYRDMKCQPGSNKPCFNRQIGLCPGVCTEEISKKEYQKTIRNIQLLFEGKKELLIKRIKQRMSQAAKRRDFEKAAELRNTIFALKHIQDISLIKNDIFSFQSSQELWNENTRRGKWKEEEGGRIFRIEGYDVAHMAGDEVVGVMTVVEDGEVKKSDYRMFTMKTALTGGDVPALKELLERRLRHDEWQMPDLIVVDGGKAQVNVAIKTVDRVVEMRNVAQSAKVARGNNAHFHYPVDNSVEKPTQGRTLPVIVGVVKDEHHRPKRIVGPRDLIREYEREILLANAEAHRFTISFHRNRLRKRLR